MVWLILAAVALLTRFILHQPFVAVAYWLVVTWFLGNALGSSLPTWPRPKTGT